MEDNKLNGFNNGRDTTDGVGGEEWSLNDKLKWEKENSPYVYKPSVKEAVEVLCNALREDKEPGSYYDSWKANLACAIMDEYNEATYNDLMPNMANRAAERFLNLLINK